ncbi:MAG: hypothetical protein IJ125_03960 [Atopobiaceae bacterium]|nr:hypothetical protein [Atopobiaceae bacterium]
MSAQISQALHVAVPATSANLGVGYDCLGLALDVWMRVHAQVADDLVIRGGDERYRNPDNLIWTSYIQMR